MKLEKLYFQAQLKYERRPCFISLIRNNARNLDLECYFVWSQKKYRIL